MAVCSGVPDHSVDRSTMLLGFKAYGQCSPAAGLANRAVEFGPVRWHIEANHRSPFWRANSLGGSTVGMRLVANKPTVISETIEGETIIIHLGTGTYYSLEGTGADVWSALESSITAREIADRLEARYDVEGDEALQAVESVLTDLSTEELVRQADGEPVAAPEPAAPVAERQEFVPPKLAKYTDMQDIILLDPVHEVDERGWPYARA